MSSQNSKGAPVISVVMMIKGTTDHSKKLFVESPVHKFGYIYGSLVGGDGGSSVYI